ncbi:MAG: hypothetical protein MUQ75_00870 [Crocinitomicaceae bacterium]|nr:hypothetical protein [Crocinitomicaceae bacterium]
MSNLYSNIITEALEEVACNNTSTCQINLQSESARKLVTQKILEKLSPAIHHETSKIIEDILLSSNEYKDRAGNT